jgi:hypothetical protein
LLLTNAALLLKDSTAIKVASSASSSSIERFILQNVADKVSKNNRGRAWMFLHFLLPRQWKQSILCFFFYRDKDFNSVLLRILALPVQCNIVS